MENKTFIKRLSEENKEDIKDHFKSLSKETRYNRFCTNVSNEGIDTYVENMNFKKNGIFGVFDEKLNLIGLGECVFYDKNKDEKADAEVAFSVKESWQGNGLGNKLLSRLVRFANINDAKVLRMYCLRSNKVVIHLAKKYHLSVSSDRTDTLAHIEFDDEYQKRLHEINEKNEDLESTELYKNIKQKK